MTRYDIDSGIPTLAVALAEHMNADELKVLAMLTNTRAPTRKAELVEHILAFLEGDRLRTVWRCLDDLQQAAVAEVVHAPSTAFAAERFRAKYGRLPDFGSVSRWSRDQRPTALRFFFYAIERGGGVMPDDLKERLEAFVPAPPAATVKSLEELPATYDRPFERWNARMKKQEHGTEPVPLTVRETERSAQRELLSVLRLVDAGKVAVSDTTRRASAATIEAITAVLEGGGVGPERQDADGPLGRPARVDLEVRTGVADRGHLAPGLHLVPLRRRVERVRRARARPRLPLRLRAAPDLLPPLPPPTWSCSSRPSRPAATRRASSASRCRPGRGRTTRPSRDTRDETCSATPLGTSRHLVTVPTFRDGGGLLTR
jgi:hypothetical protein